MVDRTGRLPQRTAEMLYATLGRGGSSELVRIFREADAAGVDIGPFGHEVAWRIEELDGTCPDFLMMLGVAMAAVEEERKRGRGRGEIAHPWQRFLGATHKHVGSFVSEAMTGFGLSPASMRRFMASEYRPFFGPWPPSPEGGEGRPTDVDNVPARDD